MSDDEDDFVTYGNALDPLDEENLPRKKPVAIEDQIVTDAQGRRRFHGAFTGGFSAGYFNSVGTRDGWRPQQFKSTRSSKADNVVQRPEDFMDEEDTGEFGIAPTAIRATEGYSDQVNKGKKRERAKQDSTGPIPGTPVLKQILVPIRERVGVMLLKKMGWKPGQGVGPRLTKQEKKKVKQKRENVKMYGCSLPNQQAKANVSESESSDDEYANITFAPDDYEPFRCDPKDNYFGIGYSGLDRRPILTEHINLFDAPAFSVQEKNKKLSIKGQAFGVGAFETEDDDIYAREDMSRYDFALGPDRKSKSRWSKEEKPKTEGIEGFIPAKEQLSAKKIFAAPALPNNFQPVHKVRKSRFSPLAMEEADKRKRHEMNAESRAKIINDDRPSIIESTKTESKNSSVAAKLITRSLNLYGKEQTAERQKLEQNTPKKTAMSWLDKLSSTTFVKGETIGLNLEIQGLLRDTSVLKGSEKIIPKEETNLIKPSFADLDKQSRFEQYLKFSESERKLKFASVQPLSMTDWDRDQEVQEFEKAARMCENIDKAAADEIEKKEEEKKEADKKVDLDSLNPENRMTAAAKMKMFGKLTRTDVEWKPAKLVCVRFNIAEPFVGVAEEGKKKKFSIFDSLAWNEMSKFEKGKRLEYECEPGPSTSSDFSYATEEADYRIENIKESPSRKRLEDECEPGPSTSSNFSFIAEKSVYRTENIVKESPSKIKPEAVCEKEKAFEESYEKVFRKNVDNKETSEIEEIENPLAKPEEPAVQVNIQEKKDLYKSIFLSSSEESESESEETKTIDDEKLKAALIGKSAAELNAQRNTSPPRGIFAKLDLDSLLKRPDKVETPKEKSEDKTETIVEEVKEAEGTNAEIEKQDSEVQMEEVQKEEDLPPDVYGPALPKALPQSSDALSQKPVLTGSSKKVTESDDDMWVEKSRDKKKSKKEKKKHKHKERSRSKSRKKSKKEKRH